MVGWLGKEYVHEVLHDKTKKFFWKKKKKKNHPIKSNFNCSHLTPNRVNFVLLEERNPRGENSF